MTTESKVKQKILQCIDDALQALGDGGRKAIYYYLEKNLGLKREEIPRKPEIFWKGLNSIFGEEGARIIEKWILQKLGISFELKVGSKLTFFEAIAIIKAKPRGFLS